jgi:hypothetical protein
MMKNWIFTIPVSGYGDTPEVAWAEAIDTILEDLHGFLDEDDLPEYERYEAGDLEDDEEDDEEDLEA